MRIRQFFVMIITTNGSFFVQSVARRFFTLSLKGREDDEVPATRFTEKWRNTAASVP